MAKNSLVVHLEERDLKAHLQQEHLNKQLTQVRQDLELELRKRQISK